VLIGSFDHNTIQENVFKDNQVEVNVNLQSYVEGEIM
jgi:hypothetical protein